MSARRASAGRAPRGTTRRAGIAGAAALAATMMAGLGEAEAQYTGEQLAFEVGYQFLEDDLGLRPHEPVFGVRVGVELTERIWYTTRALLSFRDDLAPRDRTVLLLHLTPLDLRYYFLTDRFRPFLGASTAVHILGNTPTRSVVQWGGGPVGGFELELRRNLYFGVQVDAAYLYGFGNGDVESFHANTQLIFFL